MYHKHRALLHPSLHAYRHRRRDNDLLRDPSCTGITTCSITATTSTALETPEPTVVCFALFGVIHPLSTLFYQKGRHRCHRCHRCHRARHCRESRNGTSSSRAKILTDSSPPVSVPPTAAETSSPTWLSPQLRLSKPTHAMAWPGSAAARDWFSVPHR